MGSDNVAAWLVPVGVVVALLLYCIWYNRSGPGARRSGTGGTNPMSGTSRSRRDEYLWYFQRVRRRPQAPQPQAPPLQASHPQPSIPLTPIPPPPAHPPPTHRSADANVGVAPSSIGSIQAPASLATYQSLIGTIRHRRRITQRIKARVGRRGRIVDGMAGGDLLQWERSVT